MVIGRFWFSYVVDGTDMRIQELQYSTIMNGRVGTAQILLVAALIIIVWGIILKICLEKQKQRQGMLHRKNSDNYLYFSKHDSFDMQYICPLFVFISTMLLNVIRLDYQRIRWEYRRIGQ